MSEARLLSPETREETTPHPNGLRTADGGGAPVGSGFRVVLTADRSLMADYATLFDGMVTGSQTSRTPFWLTRLLFAPGVDSQACRAGTAPLGLRRLEAAVVRGGWETAEVAVVPPERLTEGIGPDTRIIGISCGDPLGLGMNSTTMVGISGGKIEPQRSFQKLVRRIRRLRRAATGAKVVVGGPGAWQLAVSEDARRRAGIDHIVTGYCEGNIGRLLAELADDRDMPERLHGEGVPADRIPPILAPAAMGATEISRGCGLGCGFCALGRTPMEHLPADTILSDVRTNVEGGCRSLSLVTEDLFRYGGEGLAVRPEALIDLLERIRDLAGARLVQADHANIASVLRFSGRELTRVRDLLAGRRSDDDYVWLNLGVETASGTLLAASGGAAKMAGIPADEWGDVCYAQVERLCEAGFFPLVSLMLGLPGETEDHLRASLEWVRRLAGKRVAVFPVLYAPMDGSRAFGPSEMSRLHWQLIRRCYQLNFRWTPRLVWNNQSRAGVPLWRRALVQALGKGQVAWWRALFFLRSHGVKRP